MRSMIRFLFAGCWSSCHFALIYARRRICSQSFYSSDRVWPGKNECRKWKGTRDAVEWRRWRWEYRWRRWWSRQERRYSRTSISAVLFRRVLRTWDPFTKAEFNEKLRKYELERFKYYFAIAECDSAKTAQTLYDECDGVEFSRTANMMDLRFIPDNYEINREPRDFATSVPPDYTYKRALRLFLQRVQWDTKERFCIVHCRAPTFQSNALQHSKVKLTWDADDVHRSKVLKRRKFTEDEIKEEDFAAFLASESEDEPLDEDAGFETLFLPNCLARSPRMFSNLLESMDLMCKHRGWWGTTSFFKQGRSRYFEPQRQIFINTLFLAIYSSSPVAGNGDKDIAKYKALLGLDSLDSTRKQKDWRRDAAEKDDVSSDEDNANNVNDAFGDKTVKFSGGKRF